jgi:hypothetical protein
MHSATAFLTLTIFSVASIRASFIIKHSQTSEFSIGIKAFNVVRALILVSSSSSCKILKTKVKILLALSSMFKFDAICKEDRQADFKIS